jgi:hypothetical protein
MARPSPRLVALTAAAALLVGCSSSYHAGDQASREWDAWVKDHPLAGARVTDAVGTNVQPFQGTFEAYARLTADQIESNIVKAMASMCRFDDETSSRTTYWLQIDRVSLQAPCSKGDQQKVAAFWGTVHDLPGIEELSFSSKGIGLNADDASLTTLIPAISDAADATGHAGRKSVNEYRSPLVAVTQAHGQSLSTELRLTQGVLEAAGADVKEIQVVAGRVSAATKGTVDEAHTWQDSVGEGSKVLTVTPARVRTELPLTADGRDVIDRLATDDRVLAINVIAAFWEVETPSTKDARSLAADLANEPGATALGHFQLDVGPSDYDSVTGEGRTCFVRPDFAHPAHAAAILDLCDLKPVVDVDDRFDAALTIRYRATNLRPVLAILKQAPYGLPIYLLLPQNNTLEFTTGEKLTLDFPDAQPSKELEALWESLPG